MIVVDLDGSTFDNMHRWALVPKDKSSVANWYKFNKACLRDRAIMPVINLVKHLATQENAQIAFVTSRGEDVREETKRQIYKHFAGYGSRLKMRPMDDNRCTVDYKRDVLEELKDEFNEWSIIIDDHPGIVEMVKKDFPQLNCMLVPSYDCTIRYAHL